MLNSNTSNPLEAFIGTRVEIMLDPPEATQYGWVISVSAGQMVIQVPNFDGFQKGKELNIKLSCTKSTCELICKFIGLNGENFVFETPTVIRLNPPEGVLRRQSPIKVSQVWHEEKWHESPVVDISPSGFAVLTELSLEQDQMVKVSLTTPEGAPIEMIAGVVYCRFDQETQKFRVGFLNKTVNRVDGARWAKLLAN